jgi:hypothetical protein
MLILAVVLFYFLNIAVGASKPANLNRNQAFSAAEHLVRRQDAYTGGMTTDGTCGKENSGWKCGAAWGDCCNVNGICGNGPNFCGTGW